MGACNQSCILLQPNLLSASRPINSQCEQQQKCADRADAVPLSKDPGIGARDGAEGAADEVRDHVDGVETTARRRVQAVDARLVGDVRSLRAEVEQDDADDQAPEEVADERAQPTASVHTNPGSIPGGVCFISACCSCLVLATAISAKCSSP